MTTRALSAEDFSIDGRGILHVNRNLFTEIFGSARAESQITENDVAQLAMLRTRQDLRAWAI